MNSYAAIDFGTSNSAVYVGAGAQGSLTPLERDRDTMPTAVFFNADERTIVFGRQAIAEYQLAKGAIAARAAALKIEAAVKKGTDLGAAMAALGLPLPPVDQVNLPREQVQAMGQQTPPPLAMLFALAKGQVKLMAAPRNRGWYVVKVTDVIPGQVAKEDPRLPDFRRTMAQVTSAEYSQQLRAAMRNEVGVKRNDPALNALKTRLTGGN